jgi:glycerol kinase
MISLAAIDQGTTSTRCILFDRAGKAGCVSCNRCLAAVVNHIPVKCYQKKWLFALLGGWLQYMVY